MTPELPRHRDPYPHATARLEQLRELLLLGCRGAAKL